MIKNGLFTGSFDPVTNGHVDLIKRGANLFDKLYVGIFYNKNKQGFFTIEERKRMLERTLKDIPNVQVITAQNSLAVDIARRLEVNYLLRGLRNVADLDYETNLAFYNGHLATEIETVLFLSSPELSQVSSSRVRELIHFHADISRFVPAPVLEEVEKKCDNFTTI